MRPPRPWLSVGIAPSRRNGQRAGKSPSRISPSPLRNRRDGKGPPVGDVPHPPPTRRDDREQCDDRKEPVPHVPAGINRKPCGPGRLDEDSPLADRLSRSLQFDLDSSLHRVDFLHQYGDVRPFLVRAERLDRPDCWSELVSQHEGKFFGPEGDLPGRLVHDSHPQRRVRPG